MRIARYSLPESLSYRTQNERGLGLPPGPSHLFISTTKFFFFLGFVLPLLHDLSSTSRVLEPPTTCLSPFACCRPNWAPVQDLHFSRATAAIFPDACRVATAPPVSLLVSLLMLLFGGFLHLVYLFFLIPVKTLEVFRVTLSNQNNTPITASLRLRLQKLRKGASRHLQSLSLPRHSASAPR